MGKNLIKKTSLQGEVKNKRVSQTDVPGSSLTKALRVAIAISDNYAKHPTKPLRVAEAMGMTPTSGPFRMLCGAAIAYGLTDGGYNADFISLTPLGKRIVAPTKEGDDLIAKREATLIPRIIREFLTRYNNSKLPSEQIAINVIEELGVPRDKAKSTLDLILESAKEVGFLREVKGNLYVDLESQTPSVSGIPEETETAAEVAEVDFVVTNEEKGKPPESSGPIVAA